MLNHHHGGITGGTRAVRSDLGVSSGLAQNPSCNLGNPVPLTWAWIWFGKIKMNTWHLAAMVRIKGHVSHFTHLINAISHYDFAHQALMSTTTTCLGEVIEPRPTGTHPGKTILSQIPASLPSHWILPSHHTASLRQLTPNSQDHRILQVSPSHHAFIMLRTSISYLWNFLKNFLLCL